jgi:hypothetical protein
MYIYVAVNGKREGEEESGGWLVYESLTVGRVERFEGFSWSRREK